MPRKDLILDPSEYDLERVVADAEQIRQHNPQRFEMEQLTAIVFDDVERGVCVGYKDVTPDEFWVRGHMPGMPLMPGVIMCEAAAQLCSYHAHKHNLLGVPMIGFGGLDDVRFRGAVQVGDRLVIVCEKQQLRIGPDDPLPIPGLRERQSGLRRQHSRHSDPGRRSHRPRLSVYSGVSLLAPVATQLRPFRAMIPLYDLNPHHRFPWVTVLIIVANVAVTALMATQGDERSTQIVYRYGFIPKRVTELRNGKPVVVRPVEIDRRGQQVDGTTDPVVRQSGRRLLHVLHRHVSARRLDPPGHEHVDAVDLW